MEFFVENINLLLFFPFILCLIIGLNGLLFNKIDNITLFLFSISNSIICNVFAIVVFLFVFTRNNIFNSNFMWLSFEDFSFYLGTFLDKTSVSFLLLTAILSLFIQVLAFIKTQNDFNFPRLLFYLNLFYLGLNGIFLSSNLFQTYLFCEIVGVASYLMINFDFSNRLQSRAGIKSFIYNRIGDLALLFCVLTIMYFAMFYNELTQYSVLSYSNLGNVALSISSLLDTPMFVMFSSVLLFVVVMKFIQSFEYVLFESDLKNSVSVITLMQNTLLVFVGIYLFLRLDSFFYLLGKNWFYSVIFLILLFLFLFLLNRIFIPMCKIFLWIEKYLVETFTKLFELLIRMLSYFCERMQSKNFQTNILYSLIGLIFIFILVLIIYLTVIRL